MDSFFPGGVPAALRSGVENPLLSGALLSITVTAVLVTHTLRSWLRLRHIKGPALAGFTNLWLVRVIMGGNTHWELGAANEKYGEL